jgi:hypothetical protein
MIASCGPKLLAVLVIIAAWFEMASACALAVADPARQEPIVVPADSDEPPPELPRLRTLRENWRGLIELKRQNTSRNSPEESTQTQLKIDTYFGGPLALFRIQIPFPDEDTDFGGSPFNPKLGDIKTRFGFRAFKVGRYRFPTFIEITYPTASPESLGAGKYQLSEGIRMLAPVTLPLFDPSAHRTQFEGQAQQVNSIGGDPTRKNISYTKFELTVYDIWRDRYTFKLKLKPTVDWTQDGKTGAVGEIEGGILFARYWRTWLMLGHRLWGPDGIPGTYEDRVEIGISRRFD